MSGVYMASKALYRPHWRKLRAAGAPIISRWIDIGDDVPDDQIDFLELWEWCIEDVQKCDTLIAVAFPGERLKGVLIEVGAALAMGKEVLLLGDPGRENGTWPNHPRIQRHPHDSMEKVIASLRNLFTYRYG